MTPSPRHDLYDTFIQVGGIFIPGPLVQQCRDFVSFLSLLLGSFD
jgi:hypothetical protein